MICPRQYCVSVYVGIRTHVFANVKAKKKTICVFDRDELFHYHTTGMPVFTTGGYDTVVFTVVITTV